MKTLQYCLLIALMFVLLPAKAQIPKLNSYPAAAATVFLDFDGQFVTGSLWNYNGDISAAPAGLSTAAITEIFNRVAEDYRPFNLNITTDSSVYWSAPKKQRVRIIVTASSQWYGLAGGVAFIGSFSWGDNTPAWVFSALLNNNTKWVAEAISHETGHTLGLQHQSVYDANCNKTAEYSTGQGTGEIGWAPIMGAGYYQNHTTWNIGPSTVGCNTIQNDFDLINASNVFGLRPDDVGDNNAAATNIAIVADTFAVNGLISTTADQDVFKLVIPNATLLNLYVTPQNVGSGDVGANLDVKVTLLNGNDTISSYNPLTLLNAGVDTNINAGTYYIVVSGVGNMYHNNVGSIGLYNIAGSIASILPVKNIQFSGTANNGMHLLSWSFETNEALKQVMVESSSDGVSFTTLASLNPAVKTFSYQPLGKETVWYRLKFITAGGRQTYASNIISLKSKTTVASIQLIQNGSSHITVKSGDNFAYHLYNMGGQLISSGKLFTGVNQVPALGAKGLLLLNCSNSNQSFTQKLIKE